MTQPEKHVTTILNYGGGRQTIAMLVMIAKGVFPRPDYVVCADTGREIQSTWDYLEAVARPYCAPHGIEIHVAPHSLSTVDLYGLNGDLLVPAYTPTGKLPKFCSTEWKTRVVSGPGVYLHHSAVPLAEADIDRGPETVREDQCSLGACFT